ncbi:hypothetical protein TW75_02255 [Pseudoalteromonas piscicida]|nr:hypothetical protein TW75_02255 [Pseudoalteromonas piscicida]
MPGFNQGFTLVEALIVILIIGVLASISLPYYNLYTDRARFSEVVLASALYKNAIESIYITGKSRDLKDFDAGNLGIPNNDSDQVLPNKYIEKATVVDGIITIESNIKRDGKGVTFILTPTPTLSGTIHWKVSGSCIDAGLC